MNRQDNGEQNFNYSSMKQELDNEKTRHLRTLADFDNYRKRVDRDNEYISTRGKKELIKDLLPVLDNLERALAQIKNDSGRQGLEMVYQQLLTLLRQQGLETVESLGKPFDPREHEGIGYLENTALPQGHVAEELIRGYRIGPDLLRPAQVRVSKRPVKTS
jgi:molecular chaperone GrpE